MKNIIMGGVIIGVLGFAGTALGANVGKQIVRDNGLWAYVEGTRGQTSIHRVVDSDNKNVCYVAYHAIGASTVPEVDCVHMR